MPALSSATTTVALLSYPALQRLEVPAGPGHLLTRESQQNESIVGDMYGTREELGIGIIVNDFTD